jgi:hypothetical protein
MTLSRLTGSTRLDVKCRQSSTDGTDILSTLRTWAMKRYIRSASPYIGHNGIMPVVALCLMSRPVKPTAKKTVAFHSPFLVIYCSDESTRWYQSGSD